MTSLAQQAKVDRARPRVPMLTTFDTDEYVYDAMKAGGLVVSWNRAGTGR